MQPGPSIDLDAYLARIGYAGPRDATLDTLRGIHLCHTQAIAFENLTPFLRQPVLLDLTALQRKLVHGGRGGYCFEQNMLLRAALLALGFEVIGLAARVRLGAPEGVVTARGHMLLLVRAGGQPHIADVGFGGMTPTAPLALVQDIAQPTPHEPYRLTVDRDAYVLQAQIGDEWRSLYSFDLSEQHLPDYEVTSWYLSNHPDSHFVTGLIAARPDSGRRYALRNNQLSVHHLGGPTEHRTLSSAAELRGVLEDLFRLTLPATPELDAALHRLAALSE